MSERLNDYFAAEALEYLEEIEELLAGRGSPAPDQFFRLTTGVRGSAQMADAHGVVALAQTLENAARDLVSGTTRWSDELHSLAAETVQDLKGLIRALADWGSVEETRLRNAVGRWDSGPGNATRKEERVVPISDLFFDDAGPHILEAPAAQANDRIAVPIGELLFAGEAALREALALRPRVEEAARRGTSAQLAHLLEELFDLVELGMETDPTG